MTKIPVAVCFVKPSPTELAVLTSVIVYALSPTTTLSPTLYVSGVCLTAASEVVAGSCT